jgi:hypothetical protein
MDRNNNALIVQPKPQLTPETWQMIAAVAPAMHQARLFGIANPEQGMAIMLKGYELGLGLTASFEFVQVIQGRPTLSPRGMLALIQQSPECVGLKVEDIADDKGAPYGCRVTMKRRNGFEYTATFTMDDARRAGLVKAGGGWESYPANMCRWRAIGFCADVVFPDLIGGMKRADELGATISPDGDVIEGSWQTVDAAAGISATPTEPTSANIPTLSDLVERYGAEAVMAANGDAIPGTDEEVAAVAAKLEEAGNG